MIGQLLQHYQPWLPFIALLAIGLGVISVFLLLIMGKNLSRRSAERMAMTRPPAARPSFHDRFTSLKKGGSSIREWIQTLYHRMKDIPDDGNAESFREARKKLRTYMNTSNAEYEMPWYLMVGPVRSGKSTLLHDMECELPFGKPDINSENLSEINWWFHDRAVIIDTRGSMFLSEYEADSDETTWTQILDLLGKYRPKRPLDGLIVTLPATDLYGATRPDEDILRDRAKYIYGKLWKLQNHTGMRLPIYIVVTKCDVIPGFKDFAAEIPAHARNDIFGWSCPWSLETSFASHWIQDIFNSIHRSLTRARAAIFTEGRIRENREGNLLFATAFYHMKDALGAYLCAIFKDSAYHESFFLRGVYFTGKANTQIFNTISPSENGVAIGEEGKRDFREKSIFLRDLFQKKIFRENALAQPVLRIMISARRRLNLARAIAAMFFLMWSGGIIWEYQLLQQDRKTLSPALTIAEKIILELNSSPKTIKNSHDNTAYSKFLEEQVRVVLERFAGIQNVNTFMFAMPSSWFSNLDRKIELSMMAVYNRLILPALHTSLVKRGEELVSTHHMEYPRHMDVHGKKLLLNPVLTPSFKILNQWIDNLLIHEQNVEKYNNLKTTRNIHDLGHLVKYAFNHDLPQQFYSNTRYYEAALGASLKQLIDLDALRVQAGQKTGLLFRHFLDHTFNIHENYPVFSALQKSLTEFSHYGGARQMDDKNLRQIVQDAIAVADIISNGQFSWIDKGVFEPAPEYTRMMNQIMVSRLLGKNIAREISMVAEQEFAKFRLTLAGFNTPLTGPFLSIRDNQIASGPSDTFVAFIDAVTAFMGEPFMASSGVWTLTPKIPAGKLLFWDDAVLQKASSLIDTYTDYITQKLEQVPQKLREIFKMIARNSLRKKVSSLTAQAQTFQPGQSSIRDSMIPREIIQSVVRNITVATPHFTKILGTLEENTFIADATALRHLLLEQSSSILESIDHLLDSESLYTAREEEFEQWDGESMAGLKAFGVHDLADMKNYLTSQRHRIDFLSKELAEPILTLLSLGFMEGTTPETPLMFKWTRIASVIRDYERQSPSNSLKLLEKFLTYDLNEMTLDNCLAREEDFINLDTPGDYFLEIRNHYARMIENRCQNITSQKAIERFNRAATFFNSNLAGRFPFTRDGNKPGEIEADPGDTQTFFRIFDGLGKKERLVLADASRRIGMVDNINRFISHIESIRPLIMGAFTSGKPGEEAGLRIEVAFRSDRHLETGADKIIDWVMDFGDRKIDFRKNEPVAHWTIGAPVNINFRWALDSDYIPLGDPRKPALSVVGPNAVFSYHGHWALIRLIREHGFSSPIPGNSDIPESRVLEFQIPTAYSSSCYGGKPPLPLERKTAPARIFCRLSVQSPMQQENKESADNDIPAGTMQTLDVPYFPYEAPVVRIFGFGQPKNAKVRP